MARSARNLVLIALVTAVVACLLTILVLAPMSPARSAEGEPSLGPLLGEGDLRTLDGKTTPLAAPVGLGGDVNPTGDAIAAGFTEVSVLHSDGTLSFLEGEVPRLSTGDLWYVIEQVRWSGDGTYVVAGAWDDQAGAPGGPGVDSRYVFWRFTTDEDPVLLDVPAADTLSFDTDPDSDLLAFVDDGNLHLVDAVFPEAAPEQVETSQDGSILGVAWGAEGDRLLLLYLDGDQPVLGWVDDGGGTVTELRRLSADDTGEGVVLPVLTSPDGSHVAWNSEGELPWDGSTHVLPLSDPTSDPVVLPGFHWSWQPCFDDVCTEFVTPLGVPDAPPRPDATSGPAGGPTTVRINWVRPAENGADITSYRVRALRLDREGAVVTRRTTVTSGVVTRLVWRLPQARYTFRVRAENEVGRGPWSPRSTVARAR